MRGERREWRNGTGAFKIPSANRAATFGGFGAFPRGTTVYLGNQIDAGPDRLPKRISNILSLE